MMARNRNVPFKGRIQKRKTCHLQIVTFGLQRAAPRVVLGQQRSFLSNLIRERVALWQHGRNINAWITLSGG